MYREQSEPGFHTEEIKAQTNRCLGARTFRRCFLACSEVTVVASADDGTSKLEDAYGIWVPEVAGRFATNLRSTDSALRAK